MSTTQQPTTPPAIPAGSVTPAAQTLGSFVTTLKAAESLLDKGAAHAMLAVGLVLVILPSFTESLPASAGGLPTVEFVAVLAVGAVLMIAGGAIRLIDVMSRNRQASQQLSAVLEARTKAYEDYLAALDRTGRENGKPSPAPPAEYV